MKKSLICALFLFLLLPISYVNAWSNGWESYPYANNIADYNFKYNYGTSDWIGNGAIWRLQEEDATRYQWLTNFMYHIFVGTESPFNLNVDFVLNGTQVHGKGNINLMNISFTSGVLSSNILNQINSTYNEIKNYLNASNFDVAAFYFGEMIGYIQYASFFPLYNINGIKYDTYASEIQQSIYEYTSNENATRYFTRTESALSSQTPQNLAQWMTTNIYNGSSMNCTWFNKTFPYIDPIYDRNEWVSNINITQRNYYQRIEQILNMAIHVSASLFHSCMVSTGTVGGDFMPYNGKTAHVSRDAWIISACIISGVFVITLIIQWRKGKN